MKTTFEKVVAAVVGSLAFVVLMIAAAVIGGRMEQAKQAKQIEEIEQTMTIMSDNSKKQLELSGETIRVFKEYAQNHR